MKNILCFLCILVMCLGSVTTATAVSFTATLTADNHYGLYYGDENEIFYVGMNEKGSGGNPGLYNWSFAETHTFDVDEDDYIYVVGWSDDYYAQGWIGEFVSNEGTIFSNTSDWEVFLNPMDANLNLDDDDDAPTADDLESAISPAQWITVPYSLDHGISPWGNIQDISSEADWIWGYPLMPGSGNGEYQVFRTQVSPVPEPATMLLLGTGLIGLAGIGKRKFLKR